MTLPCLRRYFLALTFLCLLKSPVFAAPDIEITELSRTDTQSTHRVRVYAQEKPHFHATHDSSVVVEKGGGVLYMNGIAYHLKPGDHIQIPREVPHYFVHQSSEPYTEALVVFTPAFDGKDRILISSGAVGWTTKVARVLERIFQLVSLSFVWH